MRSDRWSSTSEYGSEILYSLGRKEIVPFLLWLLGLQTMHGIGTSLSKKGEAVMADTNQAPWIDTNLEVVETYLKKEFENFSIAHRADKSLTYTFTVTDGKKLFKLFLGWPIIAERKFPQASIDCLVQENVPGEMLYMETRAITGCLHKKAHPLACSRARCSLTAMTKEEETNVTGSSAVNEQREESPHEFHFHRQLWRSDSRRS